MIKLLVAFLASFGLSTILMPLIIHFFKKECSTDDFGLCKKS